MLDWFPSDLAGWFRLFLVVVAHGIIVVSIIATTVFILKSVVSGPDRVISGLAVLCALLFYFLSKVMHVGLSELVSETLTKDPLRVPLFLLAIVFPAIAGIVAEVVVALSIIRGGVVSKRLTLLFTTLLLLLFIDTYLAALHPGAIDLQLAPNASFVLGIAMTLLFSEGETTLRR